MKRHGPQHNKLCLYQQCVIVSVTKRLTNHYPLKENASVQSEVRPKTWTGDPTKTEVGTQDA